MNESNEQSADFADLGSPIKWLISLCALVSIIIAINISISAALTWLGWQVAALVLCRSTAHVCEWFEDRFKLPGTLRFIPISLWYCAVIIFLFGAALSVVSLWRGIAPSEYPSDEVEWNKY